jgi:acyl-CoA thioester hydrolase
MGFRRSDIPPRRNQAASSRIYNLCVDIRQLPLTFQAKVETSHLDLMDHMNVMWYTHFFDRAIWGFYDLFGFGEDYHKTSGFGSFGLEMYTRHLAELRLGDEIKIYTRAIARNSKLFHHIHFMQRVRDGELAATCELLGVHINLATRRSAPLPANIAEGLDKLIVEHNKFRWEPPLNGSIKIK